MCMPGSVTIELLKMLIQRYSVCVCMHVYDKRLIVQYCILLFQYHMSAHMCIQQVFFFPTFWLSLCLKLQLTLSRSRSLSIYIRKIKVQLIQPIILKIRILLITFFSFKIFNTTYQTLLASCISRRMFKEISAEPHLNMK